MELELTPWGTVGVQPPGIQTLCAHIRQLHWESHGRNPIAAETVAGVVHDFISCFSSG